MLHQNCLQGTQGENEKKGVGIVKDKKDKKTTEAHAHPMWEARSQLKLV